MQSAPSTPSSSHDDHSSFIKKRSQVLSTLNITVEEYEHRVTGATHYHLASDNPENVFLVALRTVPMDSSGVAHILEHTALCGSKKFPVRDPFFMMIRRSMNTFMNAFTSSDWTAYPFASQNTKDFNNLLEVYMDAVFFSSLNKLDFAQEGHRLEFSEAQNPASPLVYKGVVYNEMKGAMSSPSSIVWQLLCKHLFPTATYHYNSGGEPDDIPSLSYEELLDFYKLHYHPSNAIFMTYGDIPAAVHQEKFEALALKEFSKLDVHIEVKDEQRYQQPLHVQEHYPLDEESIEDKTHVVIAWLLGKNTNLEDLYKAQLLSSVLMDNSASPLLHALETSDLGRSPSPLSGLEDSYREMSFICGLEGCAEDSTDAIEKLILDSLEKIVEHGIEQEKVEAALHSLELHQREISGDSYPYGLQLILSALSTATHRGDPIELLDIDPVLASLKEEIKDPRFIPDLIQQYLLSNSHKVVLTVKPDSTLSGKNAAAETDRLAAIKAALSDDEKQAIMRQSEELEQRQNQVDDASILPKVELSDVPVEIKWAQSTTSALQANTQQYPVSFFAQGTNGLSYQQIVLGLPKLSDSLLAVLPYYSSCLTEMGIGQRSYLDIQSQQASISGGLSAYTAMRSHVDNEQQQDAFLVLSSKALYSNQDKLAQLMHDTIAHCRFDEHQRIKEIVEQICSHKEQSITSQGHSLAMGLASSKMSPISALNDSYSGLAGIRTLKQLCDNLDDPAHLQALADKFAELHGLIQHSDKQFLLIAEDAHEASLSQSLSNAWNQSTDSLASNSYEKFALPEIRERVEEAWLTSTQVNFCATAYATVPSDHVDSAPLTVLGGFLRNGFLHKTIREQGGAYGGGASQDSSAACFRFFSYRDPRLSDTLTDFERSIDWLMDKQHDYYQLEESILGIISSLDKPASPAGSAKQTFYSELFGRSKAQRAEFRQRIMDVSIADLQRVGQQYLSVENRNVGVISSKSNQAELEKLGLNIETL